MRRFQNSHHQVRWHSPLKTRTSSSPSNPSSHRLPLTLHRGHASVSDEMTWFQSDSLGSWRPKTPRICGRTSAPCPSRQPAGLAAACRQDDRRRLGAWLRQRLAVSKSAYKLCSLPAGAAPQKSRSQGKREAAPSAPCCLCQTQTAGHCGGSLITTTTMQSTRQILRARQAQRRQ